MVAERHHPPFGVHPLHCLLAYTVNVYWAGETMKELDLLEVINATHAEEERLTKSVMVGGDSKKRVGRLCG